MPRAYHSFALFLPLFYIVRVQGLSKAIMMEPPALLSTNAEPVQADSPSAWNAMLDPYPDKPRITFRPDGTFKLMVFSDVHYGENPWDAWGPEQDMKTGSLIRAMLRAERPDYVIINGDLITGENTFRENSTTLIDTVLQPLNEARIPFSSTYGNHDNQVNISHAEELSREESTSPLSYSRPSPPGVGGVGGPGNYWVPIYQTDAGEIGSLHHGAKMLSVDVAPALVLWFFDSRGGVHPDGTPMPDWVDETVAEWIVRETRAMNVAWGPPESRSAVAFVHIPPHAIRAVQENLNNTANPGLNADKLGQGSTQASNDPAYLGGDRAFWAALNTHIKNIRAVISGHDHGNEWCAREPIHDVVFCFSKHSGYGGYSSEGWGRGTRVLLFRSPFPHDGVDTYILLEDGSTRAKVTLNEEYV